MDLEIGTFLSLFKHLISRQEIIIDMLQSKIADRLAVNIIKEIRRLARKQQEQRSPILSNVILKLIQELNVDALLAKQCAEKIFEPKKKQYDVQSLVNEAYALSLESGGVIPIEIEIKALVN